LTGDVTTSAGSLSTTLAASGVTAGIYSNKALAVDAKGRITATSTSLASRSFYTQQEFVGAVNTDNWTFLVSGTGAAWSNISPGTDNAIGVKRCATGTTATGRCSATSTQTDVLKFGNGTATFEALIHIPTLSTAAQTYTVRAGFIDQTAAETTDGAFLRYTDAVNAGKFQCVTRDNSVETATDTGLTVAAATWYKVLITVNAAGTNVNCTINGGNSTNVTTNIPTASGRDTGYGIFVLKSVGTTTVTALDVDYAEVTYDFTTPR